MTAKTFTAPGPGPVLFRLDALAACVEITVSPDTATASAELSGPAEVVNGARAAASGGQWALTLPRWPPLAGMTVIQGAGTTIVTADVIPAGVSVIGGRVIVGDSMTFVNGRLVSGVNVRTVAAAEPVRLAVTLPAGSALTAEVAAGTLAVRGDLPTAAVTTTSADVNLDTTGDARVRTVSGDITARTVASSAYLRTVSGDIGVDAAAGPVTAGTISGDIAVHAAGPVTIDVTSVSGDIRVTAGPGVCPDVRARSVSGRVRATGSTR
jgi:DUF4097 and DUF4098 domain-containing protein YvlB